MKKADKAAGGKQTNYVFEDRQWIRQCKQEEINMINSLSGQKLAQINQARTNQQRNHFYPQHQRMGATGRPAQQASAAQEEAKSIRSRARDPDGLDSVSQVSVQTPKSHLTDNSHVGDSVTYVSCRTKTTTVSTKQKLEALEAQLLQEQQRRAEAEAKIH